MMCHRHVVGLDKIGETLGVRDENVMVSAKLHLQAEGILGGGWAASTAERCRARQFLSA